MGNAWGILAASHMVFNMFSLDVKIWTAMSSWHIRSMGGTGMDPSDYGRSWRHLWYLCSGSPRSSRSCRWGRNTLTAGVGHFHSRCSECWRGSSVSVPNLAVDTGYDWLSIAPVYTDGKWSSLLHPDNDAFCVVHGSIQGCSSSERLNDPSEFVIQASSCSEHNLNDIVNRHGLMEYIPAIFLNMPGTLNSATLLVLKTAALLWAIEMIIAWREIVRQTIRQICYFWWIFEFLLYLLNTLYRTYQYII